MVMTTKGKTGGGVSIKIIKTTVANGEGVEAGKTVTVSNRDAVLLGNLKRAVYAPAKAAEVTEEVTEVAPKPKPKAKAKAKAKG